MQRIIYLLVFFSASLLILKPAWGIVTERPVTETTQAAPVVAGQEKESGDKGRKKGRTPLYSPALRSDGHLKLEPAGGYILASPFDEVRQTVAGSGIPAGSSSPRLAGLAGSSRGTRAIIEHGTTVVTLAEGETKSGITLVEIDEAGRTVLIHGAFGSRTLSLNDSQP